MKRYPDVSELFSLKEERRKRLAQLPIEEKMEIADRLRRMGQEIPKLTTNKNQPERARAAKSGKW